MINVQLRSNRQVLIDFILFFHICSILQQICVKTGWHQILLVFSINDKNSHVQILKLTSTNYYQVKHFENIYPVFQKQG